MNRTTLKTAALLTAGALLGASPALALDGKVVLDQLVKKGVLTPEEADAIIQKDMEKKAANPAPPAATSKEVDSKKFTIAGKVQVQAKSIVTDDRTSNVKDQVRQGFELRRADIQVSGEIADAWTAMVDLRIETSNPTAPGDAGVQFDKAWIEYDTKGHGQILAGMKKAPIGYEEYTSSSYILPIERGIVNNYFVGNSATTASRQPNGTSTNGGYNITSGERRIGLYYDTERTSKIEKEGGTKFGMAVTNDVRRRFDSASNDFSYYLNGLHVAKINDTTFLDFGVNAAYSDSEVQAKAPLSDNEGNSGVHSVVLEAYTRLRLENFTLLAEVYQGWIENGRIETRAGAASSYESVMPVGAMLMASYLIDGTFEPVVALNYLDTDGRGVRPNDVIRDAVNTGAHDRVISLYTGVNWYLTKSKSLKLSAGLEAARFEGNEQTYSAPRKTDVYGGRMQLQALF